MNYKITDVSECSSKESPLDSKDVKLLIETQLKSIESISQLTSKLLPEFGKKSSKHKFIVQVTDVVFDETPNMNLKINANFGAAWESEKDGYLTVKLTRAEPSQDKENKVKADKDLDKADVDKEDLDKADVEKEDDKEDIDKDLDAEVEVDKLEVEQVEDPEVVDKAELSETTTGNEEPTRKDTIGGILDDYIEVEKVSQEQILVSIFWLYVG